MPIIVPLFVRNHKLAVLFQGILYFVSHMPFPDDISNMENIDAMVQDGGGELQASHFPWPLRHSTLGPAGLYLIMLWEGARDFG